MIMIIIIVAIIITIIITTIIITGNQGDVTRQMQG